MLLLTIVFCLLFGSVLFCCFNFIGCFDFTCYCIVSEIGNPRKPLDFKKLSTGGKSKRFMQVCPFLLQEDKYSC